MDKSVCCKTKKKVVFQFFTHSVKSFSGRFLHQFKILIFQILFCSMILLISKPLIFEFVDYTRTISTTSKYFVFRRHNLCNWSVVKYRFLAKNRFFMLSLKSFVYLLCCMYSNIKVKITLSTLVEFQRFGWFTEINTLLVKQKLQAFIYVSVLYLYLNWFIEKNINICWGIDLKSQ